MNPVLALVGRPNVGKSTLFNALTRTRNALVADFPGMTRDRNYGIFRHEEFTGVVIDTGGLSAANTGIESLAEAQTRLAIEESTQVIMLADARDGCTAEDEAIALFLRGMNKPITLVVNKTDGLNADVAVAEFYALGIASVHAVSALQGRGIHAVMASLARHFPAPYAPNTVLQDGIRIAFVGRPNVGKSTLINRLLGEKRLLTFDSPGTTRDSISVPFESEGQRYTFIDTAGVRRRSRISETAEKFSVVQTLQSIESAQVVILVLDASQGIVEQDASLLGLIIESGRALVITLNKWDGLKREQKSEIRRELDLRIGFAEFAEQLPISALHGTGVGRLLKSVQHAYHSAIRKISTPELNRLLADAVSRHMPPPVHGRRIKLRYMHQGGNNPPRFIIHGNQTERLPESYHRYLINYFHTALKLKGTPLFVEFRQGENPYAGRHNKLTPRQQRSRQRLMKHHKH